MSKWQAIQIEHLTDSWWIVEEVNDHGQGGRRIIYCGDDEVLAHRIARLPELEAKVDKLKSSVQSLLAVCAHAVCTAEDGPNPEVRLPNYAKMKAVIAKEKEANRE